MPDVSQSEGQLSFIDLEINVEKQSWVCSVKDPWEDLWTLLKMTWRLYGVRWSAVRERSNGFYPTFFLTNKPPSIWVYVKLYVGPIKKKKDKSEDGTYGWVSGFSGRYFEAGFVVWLRNGPETEDLSTAAPENRWLWRSWEIPLWCDSHCQLRREADTEGQGEGQGQVMKRFTLNGHSFLYFLWVRMLINKQWHRKNKIKK